MTGTEKATDLGIASLSAVLLGVISAAGGGAIRNVVVLSRVPEVFGGNTLTATCAAASAVVMIITYRVHHPAVGLACGTAIGGVLYLAARWRHWVLPSAARLRAGLPSEAPAASTEPARPAPNLNTPMQLREGLSPDDSCS